MSRKHFLALAFALEVERPFPVFGDAKDVYPVRLAQWSRIVRAVADVCASTNGAFDRERFYRAAGLAS